MATGNSIVSARHGNQSKQIPQQERKKIDEHAKLLSSWPSKEQRRFLSLSRCPCKQGQSWNRVKDTSFLEACLLHPCKLKLGLHKNTGVLTGNLSCPYSITDGSVFADTFVRCGSSHAFLDHTSNLNSSDNSLRDIHEGNKNLNINPLAL